MGADASKLGDNVVDGGPSPHPEQDPQCTHEASDVTDQNQPSLYQLIQRQDWTAALSHIRSHPRDASARFEKVMLYGRYRTNATPLHIAAAFDAPVKIVEELLDACPDAARVLVVNSEMPSPTSGQRGNATMGTGCSSGSSSSRRKSSIPCSVVSFLTGLAFDGGKDGIQGKDHTRENSTSASFASLPSDDDDGDDVSFRSLPGPNARRSSSLQGDVNFGTQHPGDNTSGDDWSTNRDVRRRRSSLGHHDPAQQRPGHATPQQQQQCSPQRTQSSGNHGNRPRQRRGSNIALPSRVVLGHAGGGNVESDDTGGSAADTDPAACASRRFTTPALYADRSVTISNEDVPSARTSRRSSAPSPAADRFGAGAAPSSSAVDAVQRAAALSTSSRPSNTSTDGPASTAATAAATGASRRQYMRSTKSFRSRNNAVADLTCSDWLPLHVAVLCRASPDVVRSILLRHPWGAKIKNGMGMLPIHVVCADMEMPPRPFAGGGESSESYRTVRCGRNGGDVAEVVTLLLRAFPESVYVCSSNADGMTPLQYAEENFSSGKTKTDVINLLKADILKVFPPIVPAEKKPMVHSFQGNKERQSSTGQRRKISLTGSTNSSHKFKADEVPKLYAHVSAGRWKAAIRRVGKCPEEASVWTMRNKVGSTAGVFDVMGGGGEVIDDPVHRLPLHMALSLNPPADVVYALVGAYPESLAAKQEYGLLPLHSACHFACSFDVVDTILKAYPQGARMRDTFGNLPIHIACGRAAPACVIRLLIGSYPEGVKVKDGKGMSPLDRALASGHPDYDEIANCCMCTVGRARPSLVDCVGPLAENQKTLFSQMA